jgi:cystathionine beta-lyase/cystathionine gamma-synthase
MSALSAAMLATLEQGDHVLLSDRLYGKTPVLVGRELSRYGVEHSVVAMRDLAATRAAFRKNTRLLVVEAIANPLLEVFDIAALAELAHAAGARLLVDNTFATPWLCRPADLGADLVMESLTKMLNGHSDVLLGYIGTRDEQLGARLSHVTVTWGLGCHPLDAWLAQRSLATFPLRMERACDNALGAAEFLSNCPAVEHVAYPGLPQHGEHALALRQCGGRFGSLVTFTLTGGRERVDNFLTLSGIPFCPSLGTSHTSLSHPASTSHRALPADAREALGIFEGTIRLSVGIEPREELLAKLHRGVGQ